MVTTGRDRCNMQHGLVRAGGSVAPQISKQKHARTRTHARSHARMCARTDRHTLTYKNITHALKHHTHTHTETHTHVNTRTYTHSITRHTHTHTHDTHTRHTRTHTHTSSRPRAPIHRERMRRAAPRAARRRRSGRQWSRATALSRASRHWAARARAAPCMRALLCVVCVRWCRARSEITDGYSMRGCMTIIVANRYSVRDLLTIIIADSSSRYRFHAYHSR